MMYHRLSNQNYKHKKMIQQSWYMWRLNHNCDQNLRQRIHHHLKCQLIFV